MEQERKQESKEEIRIDRDLLKKELAHWEPLAAAILSRQLPFSSDSTLVPVNGLRLLDYYKATTTVQNHRIDGYHDALIDLLKAPNSQKAKRKAREFLNKMTKR